MSLEAAFILPHPPLAVHEVGRGREEGIASTLAGFDEVAQRIETIAPDDIVIISPHAAYYADWIYMASGGGAHGDLAQFGAPDVEVDLRYDGPLRASIERAAEERGIPAGEIPGGARPLDHGVMVPLSFVDKRYPADRYQAVLMGGSALPREQLLGFGRCIADACAASGKRCVLLVSGDLSHKLEADGPYGFDPAGPQFDDAFVQIVEEGRPAAFADIDARMCEDAAECGLSGFIMMAGALERASELSGQGFSSELISHEGPFGVGYGVAAFERGDAAFDGKASTAPEERFDPLVDLAVRTIIQYVTDGSVPAPSQLPDGLPECAGCFVSIHTASTDDLRGCIGTIEPVQESLAEEIIANAVAASTRDPRFPAISPGELDDLEINVDVLYPPEDASIEDMDPKRYGIIVEQGYRRGLLLPDLDGVDTVEDQFRIACMKAGIDPGTPPEELDLQRFEVERHI